MAPRRIAPLSTFGLRLFGPVLACAIGGLTMPASAQQTVYRCPLPNGTVELTDRPCPKGQGTRQVVEVVNVFDGSRLRQLAAEQEARKAIDAERERQESQARAERERLEAQTAATQRLERAVADLEARESQRAAEATAPPPGWWYPTAPPPYVWQRPPPRPHPGPGTHPPRPTPPPPKPPQPKGSVLAVEPEAPDRPAPGRWGPRH